MIAAATDFSNRRSGGKVPVWLIGEGEGARIALLAAVAVYAAGGHKALADYSKRAGPGVRLLTSQLK